MMWDFAPLAEGFEYPRPGRLEELRAAMAKLDSAGVRRHFSHFIESVGDLSLAEWEELHTRTLDLGPLFVPYVGWVIWGDNYHRGEFMAELKVAQEEAGVDAGGELPDHLAPVLRLLAVAGPVPATLLEVLPTAVAKMRGELKEAERDNPYRHLLKAISEVDVPSTVGGEQ
ncbi:MAG: nitrate reductase [Acidimicrobiia bacterium]|nr:nitrate reductase [Acidimicrobiia bacterium]